MMGKRLRSIYRVCMQSSSCRKLAGCPLEGIKEMRARGLSFPDDEGRRLRQSSKGGKRSPFSAAFNLRLIHVHLIRCSPPAVATTLRLYGRTNVLVFLFISPTTDPSSRHLQLKNETKKFQKQTGKLEMRAVDRCCCCC